MGEILWMLIGPVVIIGISFKILEKYQEKFILYVSLLYILIYIMVKYNLFNIWNIMNYQLLYLVL